MAKKRLYERGPERTDYAIKDITPPPFLSKPSRTPVKVENRIKERLDPKHARKH